MLDECDVVFQRHIHVDSRVWFLFQIKRSGCASLERGERQEAVVNIHLVIEIGGAGVEGIEGQGFGPFGGLYGDRPGFDTNRDAGNGPAGDQEFFNFLNSRRVLKRNLRPR